MNFELEYNPEWAPFKPAWQVVEDLHSHTDFSDGTLTPTELVRLAVQKGIRYFAITDHDTLAGLDEAYAEARKHLNLTLIPGVELSAHTPESEMHIIGLFVNRTDPTLLTKLQQLSDSRQTTMRRTVEELDRIGISLDFNRVVEIAGRGNMGRPHVARAMLEQGYVSNFREAFDKYLAFGKPGYVQRPGMSPEEALSLVHAAGGVSVLAHPRTVAHLEKALPLMVDARLSGIEVYAEKYREEHHNLYTTLAEKYNLIVGGGSDYHAGGNRNEVRIGISGPPSGTTQKLYQRAVSMHGDRVGFKIKF